MPRARLSHKCRKQLPQGKGDNALAVRLAAVQATRSASVGLGQRVCSLGERLRIPHAEEGTSVLSAETKRSNEAAKQQHRLRHHDASKGACRLGPDARRARAVAREIVNPLAFIVTPGMCRNSCGAAPKSMKRQLCSRSMFCSAGERNDPPCRAEIALKR